MKELASRTAHLAAWVWIAAAGTVHAQEVVQSPETPSQESVTRRWTAAAKAAARPMPLRELAGTPVPAPASLTKVGAPGAVDGTPPAGAARRVKRLAPVPEELRETPTPQFGPGSTIFYAYPPPSTLYIPILDYIYPAYPHTSVGKLFFSDLGSNFVCSASSITSSGSWGAGNHQTVVTAGHCCSSGNGRFFTNFLFEPAHLAGAAPLGSWTASSATVLNAWHQNEDISRDVCVLQMRRLGGANINDAVGALGYAFNQPLPQHYHATGWPQAAPFDGKYLYIAAASDAETDTSAAGAFSFTHGIGSAMTGGSSGGAWIRQYQTYVGANQFNGLNSYKYTNPARPLEMFGPYIDDVIINSLLQPVATAPPAP
jgi:V8-like Glu-specific endopeptidase